MEYPGRALRGWCVRSLSCARLCPSAHASGEYSRGTGGPTHVTWKPARTHPPAAIDCLTRAADAGRGARDRQQHEGDLARPPRAGERRARDRRRVRSALAYTALNHCTGGARGGFSTREHCRYSRVSPSGVSRSVRCGDIARLSAAHTVSGGDFGPEPFCRLLPHPTVSDYVCTWRSIAVSLCSACTS